MERVFIKTENLFVYIIMVCCTPQQAETCEKWSSQLLPAPGPLSWDWTVVKLEDCVLIDAKFALILFA